MNGGGGRQSRKGTPKAPKKHGASAAAAAAAAAGAASPAKRQKTTTSSGSSRDRNSRQQQRQPDRGGRGGGRGRNNRKRDRGTGGDRRPNATANNARPIFERACSSISSISAAENSKGKTAPVLHWESPNSHPAVEAEEAMLKQLIKYGKKERGMFRTKPAWLVERVDQLCRYNDIDLIQALSLRRTTISLLNPGMDMAKLQLGSNDNVRASAALFEEAVEDYLHAQDVPFITEEEQQRAHKEENGIHTKTPPTPDFIFPRPTRLRYTMTGDGAATGGASSSSSTAGDSSMPLINFCEVKMFYGASSVPDGTRNAVGLIMPKLKRYVELYGPGAIVFSFGCGEQLAEKLASIGVVALDAHPLDLSRVEEHQRTWCADDNGRILP